MRIKKDDRERIRKESEIVNKSKKHEANLESNSTLYFQIGLIVCLLAAFGLLEMKFETTIPTEYASSIPIDQFDEVPIERFVEYVKPSAEPKPDVKKAITIIDKIEKVENDVELKKVLKTITTETKTSPKVNLNPDALPALVDKPEDVFVPVNFVQKVPIYPGCEKASNNAERKKCMSNKIGKLIQRKFDGNDIASNYGLQGKQKIDVQFTIDKWGRVTNVKTRSNHEKLDEEAVRVINFIPEMTPGRQNNKNIGVIYNLPIVFEVK